VTLNGDNATPLAVTSQDYPRKFSAAQIARALGKSPQAVRRAMDGITPDLRIVNGVEVATWSLAQLPERVRVTLEETAKQGQYRSAEAMLCDPPKRWEPAVPLNQIAEKDIVSAGKLRAALKPWLLPRHEVNLSTAELEAKGVADYVRVFNNRITGRYWRKLLARTLQRDRGAEDWNRLEIYLPDKPALKEQPSRVVSEALVQEFGEIDSFINACRNPASPSKSEQQGIWALALEKYQSMRRFGLPHKQAARQVRVFLFSRAPFLAPNRDALLKAFNRNLKALENEGGDLKALRDGRENNGERIELPEDDRDLLIHRAVFYYRGDIAPAWRDCLKQGFSEPIRERYKGKTQRKAHVPKSVMESVGPEVEILTVMHRGKRAFDSIKGHVDRSYEGIHSRVCFVADDFTMPVYFYAPDGSGWFNLTRGQVLIFSDFRTLRIVGYSLQPDRNYSSLTIRSLCTHVFSEHGLPKVLQFERGIWQSSTLLKGRERGALDFTEATQGLREFGILFIHSIQPRSKTVERIGGLLQDLMEAEPGYCGRDERRDAPEALRKQMAAVESRNEHPSEHFYSFEQWDARLGEIIAQYNAAPQQGRILVNRSPDAAYCEMADPDDPPMQLPAGVRYLLAHHKEQKTVTLDGVKFKIGAKTFRYRGTQISHLVGHEVIAWFDPENPESIVVTDLNRRNPICVPKANEPSALECIIDPNSTVLADEMKRIDDQASYMKARFHAIKSKFPMPQRTTIVTKTTVELGQEIESQKFEIEKAQTARARRGAANRDKARKLGVPAELVGDDDESREGLEILEASRRARECELREECATENQEEPPKQ